jgi:AcrR family transcriptional regulator
MENTAEDRGPGRPRCEDTRQSILRAAYELFEEGEDSPFTIEAVARRSGAAKTTIYRWWPSKGALVIEAFLAVAEKRSAFPATGSVADDLKTHLRSLAKLLRGRAGRLVAGIVAEGQTDPETKRAFSEVYLKPRRVSAARLIEEGMASGELRQGLDVETICDALYGPVYLRLMLGHNTMDDASVVRLADIVLDGIRAAPAKAAGTVGKAALVAG